MRPDISARSLVVAFVAILLTGSVAACGSAGPSSAPADGNLKVVATTTVLADLVGQVGGDEVTVTSLVPKGGEVHTFDPTPSDLRAVAAADLIVMNGLGLDDWLRSVVTDSGATAPVLELAPDLEGVDYLTVGDSVNPHLWLDAEYAARYVQRIVDALAGLDPARADTVRANGAAYLATLAELDTWAAARIGTIPPRTA